MRWEDYPKRVREGRLDIAEEGVASKAAKQT
jgi:hypothetical protein